jgi:hypothetical protein
MEENLLFPVFRSYLSISINTRCKAGANVLNETRKTNIIGAFLRDILIH